MQNQFYDLNVDFLDDGGPLLDQLDPYQSIINGHPYPHLLKQAIQEIREAEGYKDLLPQKAERLAKFPNPCAIAFIDLALTTPNHRHFDAVKYRFNYLNVLLYEIVKGSYIDCDDKSVTFQVARYPHAEEFNFVMRTIQQLNQTNRISMITAILQSQQSPFQTLLSFNQLSYQNKALVSTCLTLFKSNKHKENFDSLLENIVKLQNISPNNIMYIYELTIDAIDNRTNISVKDIFNSSIFNNAFKIFIHMMKMNQAGRREISGNQKDQFKATIINLARNSEKMNAVLSLPYDFSYQDLKFCINYQDALIRLSEITLKDKYDRAVVVHVLKTHQSQEPVICIAVFSCMLNAKTTSYKNASDIFNDPVFNNTVNAMSIFKKINQRNGEQGQRNSQELIETIILHGNRDSLFAKIEALPPTATMAEFDHIFVAYESRSESEHNRPKKKLKL